MGDPRNSSVERSVNLPTWPIQVSLGAFDANLDFKTLPDLVQLRTLHVKQGKSCNHSLIRIQNVE